MSDRAYEKVAVIYNDLMSVVNYDVWTDYVLDIAETYIDEEARILELAAGTCQITHRFSKVFKNIIATDISLPMLQSVKYRNFKMVCCDMISLPFKKKFDFIYCTFDSINYLLKQKQLRKLFNEINDYLEKDGIFTFDVSLELNSLKFAKETVTKGFFNGYDYKRVSRYNDRSKIHYNYFYINTASGKKISETHSQKIYDIKTYFKHSERAGLFTIACYDCFTFDDVSEKSERAQFVMRKIN